MFTAIRILWMPRFFFISFLILFFNLPVLAQETGPALEEIIVSAQRREQSLQEVPISIEVFSGDTITRQGFKDMADLAKFSPTVTVNTWVYGQGQAIRGFGTTSLTLTAEQAVPIFLDGIYYGRSAQIRSAFMDLERIEILKGPQPVFFGMNASAGAFNMQSRKPTTDWEGDVALDYGNFGSYAAKGGVGGPITDTLGIRVAGQIQKSDGFMIDVISGDRTIGAYENQGGRVTLVWNPTENFKVTSKVEAWVQSQDPEAQHLCEVGGSAIFGLAGPQAAGDEGEPTAIWLNPPKGEGWQDGPAYIAPGDCFKTDLGISGTGPYYAPPLNVRDPESTTGTIDIRRVADGELKHQGAKGVAGYDDIDSYTGYINMLYSLDNGIELNSQTAYNDYVRDFVRDNSATPFLMNNQRRFEGHTQWSTELRLTSPADSGRMMDWMLGLHWQKGYLDSTQNAHRANVRRGQRYNELWEDADWKSAFGTVTFNFMDDKAEIDLGGRYSQTDKTAHVTPYGAQFIFDVTPCNSSATDDDGGGDFNPATCTVHPLAVRVNPVTDNPKIYDPTANLSNLWTFRYNTNRNTPSNWRSPRAAAVGLTALAIRTDGAVLTDTREEGKFNPQLVLRYRPTEDHTMYAKWAQAFKSGGFDTGVSSVPTSLAGFAFGPEYAETFEVGSKGTFSDNRLRYDIAVFQVTFDDLQLSSANPDPDRTRIALNAGQQRVRGIELSGAYALTENLVFGLSGAIMDGVMTDYPNAGCTPAEFANAPASGCNPATSRIDRTGSESPVTPDWKFVLDVDYSLPVIETHKLVFNGKGYFSDGYIYDATGFTKVATYDRHGDLNLSLGFGDIDDTWVVSAYAHNLFEARPTYHPENDIFPEGIFSTQETNLSRSSFTSYGVQFKYNYQ